jgi:putative heme transporter
VAAPGDPTDASRPADPAAAGGVGLGSADPAAPPDELVVDLSVRTVATVIVAVGVLLALRAAAGAAGTAVTLIVVALFVALALDPVVGACERRLGTSRPLATALVLGVATALFAVFVAIAGPQLVGETRDLQRQIPRTIDSLGDLPLVGDRFRDADLTDRLSEALASLPQRADDAGARLGGLVRSVGFGLGAVVLGVFLVAGALVDGPRLVGRARAAVPVGGRDRADEIGRTVYRVIAKYFAGSLFVAVLNGIWVAVAALAAGVPLSPVLGVWAALTALIPQIGGVLGFALVFVVSLTAGLPAVLIMAAAFLAFMLFSNHVLVPLVVGRAVQLSPPTTMLAAVAGFSVAGVVGALFAVPLVGAVKAVALVVRGDELTPTDPPDQLSAA